VYYNRHSKAMKKLLALTALIAGLATPANAQSVEITAANGYHTNTNARLSNAGVDKGAAFIQVTDSNGYVFTFAGEPGNYIDLGNGVYQFQPQYVWVGNQKLNVVQTQKGCTTNLTISCRAQTSNGAWYRINVPSQY
jgi:hypothetical protein